MSVDKFMDVIVRERIEGTPGFVEDQEFSICLNPNQISIFNEGEDPSVVFVRMICGATFCVAMPYDNFVNELAEIGYNVVLTEQPVKKRAVKKKPAKKKGA